MRIAGIVPGCIAVTLLLSGCDPVTDQRYVNEGAGVELYTSDRAGQTELLKEYENFVCAPLGPNCGGDWSTFVLAGMNDIDLRCDGLARCPAPRQGANHRRNFGPQYRRSLDHDGDGFEPGVA